MSNLLNDNLKTKKLLVFDFDGVVFDSEFYHYLSHKATLDIYGIGSIFNIGVYKALCIGNTTYNIMKSEVLRAYSLGIIGVELFEYLDSERNFESMCKFKEDYFLKFVNNGDIPANVFILDFLKSLNGSIPAVILSASPKIIIEDLLSIGNYPDIFSDIISTSDNKSNKDFELRALLDKYNVTGNEVCFFEDNEHNLKVGQSLGIFSIGVEHDVNIDKLSSYDILIKEGVIYEK